MHKIRTQLLGLELQGDKNRSESIRNFIYQEMSNIKLRRFRIIFSGINQGRIDYIQTGDPSGLTSIIFRYLGDIDDLYTLARMFRKYPPEFRTKEKSIESHIFPHYIIEYSGEAHIRIMIKYLKKQRATITTYPTISKRCISVPMNTFD